MGIKMVSNNQKNDCKIRTQARDLDSATEEVQRLER
jgi:hypothetical protein